MLDIVLDIEITNYLIAPPDRSMVKRIDKSGMRPMQMGRMKSQISLKQMDMKT